MSQLDDNLRAVSERIQRAATAAGRDPGDVRLLAVTKASSAEHSAELFRLGARDLAENRAPAFEAKAQWFEEQDLHPRWHFIGHVQRNKARRIVRRAEVLHSVDSLRLLETLDRVAADEGRRLQVFLQVNAAREEQKDGFELPPAGATPAESLAFGELGEALAALPELRHLEPQGWMAMGPLGGGGTRAVFDEVAALGAALPDLACARCFPAQGARLSLGMSGDLEDAVAAGSHWVRIGSALFQGIPSTARPH